jgi:putative ABC transport system permease protein
MYNPAADIRYALRMLRNAPGFTAAAVLTLALGIGVNTAIFSVINTVLIQPLPYKQPDRIVMMYETEPELDKAPVTQPDLIAWRERSRTFETVSSFRPNYAALTGTDRPERLMIWEVTADFFHTVGVQPALGRGLSAEDTTAGRDGVVILSDGLFQRRFGGDRKALGRTVMIDGKSRTVIGVMPPGFQLVTRFPFKADAWLPMVLTRRSDGNHDRLAVGRLRPGATLKQAQAEMSAIAAQLGRENPNSNGKIGARLVPLDEDVNGSVRELLLALLGAVGFVLLIACANVANLLLARGVARRQELAVRAALGAGRARIAGQLLTESLLLAVLGGGIGLLLAYAGVQALRQVETLNIQRLADTSVNPAVLLYSCLITIAAGLLFGIAPALSQSRRHLAVELKSGARTVAGGHAPRLRSLLVIAELSLAVILLIGAGLSIRSVIRLLAVNPGFRPEGVLTLQLSLPEARYSFRDQASSDRITAFVLGFMDRVRSIPGVTAASVTNKLPLKGGWNGTVIVEGKPYSDNYMEGPLVEHSYILPGFFQTMGIPLRTGRVFTQADLTKDLVIVNETFARQFFPNENPVGKRISTERPPRWLEIAGVVGDTPQHGISAKIMPETYKPRVTPYITVVAHTALDPASLVEPIRKELAAMDKDVPISEVHTMNEVLLLSSAPNRVYMRLLALFAAVALALAAVGIYGLISFAMSQQRHEIGIRMALGASASDVVRMALGSASKLVAAGLVAGVAGAFMLTQYLKSLLYGVTPSDPVTFTAVPVFLAVVALAACLLPALRAGAIDPSTALRNE